jgi:hypothetical protein
MSESFKLGARQMLPIIGYLVAEGLATPKQEQELKEFIFYGEPPYQLEMFGFKKDFGQRPWHR